MFDKVLIANRGEIACRVARALRGLGVRSVAVFSEADAHMPHRRAADEAVLIGAGPPRESYLNVEAILAAARATGAQAIHPGYGFLSENADFVEACEQAGISFVGPTAAAIRSMGDKAAARATAIRAGVPVVPGSDGAIGEDEDVAAVADEVGYPVLVKASGGGGGIGMAVVKKPSKLARTVERCRDRARQSFANADVYLERLVANARHIEVQLLFDHHGRGVHLFERECSLQRRHQKVVEEAPSPFVATRPGLREALCEAALALGEAIGYRGAGTVEFIVDPSGAFYFIEMNTRLQVEHPVTECVTGVDLVALQTRVAAGEPLLIEQAQLALDGAAIEWRVYAEDPARKFLPQPGPVLRFEPPEGAGVRVDSGVESGSEMSPLYDPLMAKLVTFAGSREQALERARSALDAFTIEGTTTNLQLLRELAAHPSVAAGDFDTGWLEGYVKGR